MRKWFVVVALSIDWIHLSYPTTNKLSIVYKFTSELHPHRSHALTFLFSCRKWKQSTIIINCDIIGGHMWTLSRNKLCNSCENTKKEKWNSRQLLDLLTLIVVETTLAVICVIWWSLKSKQKHLIIVISLVWLFKRFNKLDGSKPFAWIHRKVSESIKWSERWISVESTEELRLSRQHRRRHHGVEEEPTAEAIGKQIVSLTTNQLTSKLVRHQLDTAGCYRTNWFAIEPRLGTSPLVRLANLVWANFTFSSCSRMNFV